MYFLQVHAPFHLMILCTRASASPQTQHCARAAATTETDSAVLGTSLISRKEQLVNEHTFAREFVNAMRCNSDLIFYASIRTKAKGCQFTSYPSRPFARLVCS